MEGTKKRGARRASAGWISGGCHCGAVRFRARPRRDVVLDCNCSVCVKKGNLHLIVDDADFELLSGRRDLGTYAFGTRMAQHHFCKKCGIHPFYRPNSPPDPTQWDVNSRCLDGARTRHFEIEPLDGQGIEDVVVAALKKEFPASGLEARYIGLCEAGVYDVALQTKRLRATPKALDGVVARLQVAIHTIGQRLAAEAEVSDETAAPRARPRSRSRGSGTPSRARRPRS